MIHPDMLDEETRKIYPNGVDLHKDYEVGEDGVVFKRLEGRVPTVDDLLDHVDVELKWYIPSDEAIEFMIFIRLCLGEEPENSNSKAHYFMIDCMFQTPNVKPFFMARNIDFDETKGETVILCSREFSKSTLISYFILYMAEKQQIPNFGKVNYGLYVSDSINNGVKIQFGRLKAIYNESRYLQSRFEEVVINQDSATFVRHPKTKKEIDAYHHTINVEKRDKKYVVGRMKRTFKIDGKGCMTSARGAGNALIRSQFAILDDLVGSETDAYSDTILKSIESTIDADVRGGLAPRSFVIAVGTPYTKNDPIYSRVESGIMTPVVFPRAEHVPDGTIDKKSFKSVWPDRHTYESCRRQYVMAKKAKDSGKNEPMRRLIQEHYLRISSEDSKLVPDSLIQWYKRKLIMKYLENYSVYITTDFTTTGSSGSDFSVIMVWAVSNNDDWFMLDAVVRRIEIQEQYDELFRMVSTWSKRGNYIEVGVEVDGQQKAHIFALKEMMHKKNIFFSFAKQKGAPPTREGILSRAVSGRKLDRFRYVVPMFQNRKIYFPEEIKDTKDMQEVLMQISGATQNGFIYKDDACDGISQITMIDYIPGSGSSGEDAYSGDDESSSIWADIDDEEEGTGGNTIF